MQLKELAGRDLGTRVVDFSADDAILYALAVGASASQLDLVYEQDLRVLPTYGCALGLWAVEAAGELGAYDRTRSLHVGQSLTVHEPLKPEPFETHGCIRSAFDKGRLTIVEIDVAAPSFEAAYTILLPGVGGWGGEPPPPSERPEPLVPNWTGTVDIGPDAATLYRLTGDKHPVHIDPSAAAAMGLERPILHGLATMGTTARMLAAAVGAHPADLSAAQVRFSNPVYPGCELQIGAQTGRNTACADVSVENLTVMSGTFTFQ
ncbi:MAG: enoyl-CoA hydratase [Acidimicrobiaceae bacterium]|nr:enoyl-CoA hydratase [Acidimicrobiaceae bacterium]MYE64926.1 enoyl-CoA hydratase [Acidimicrobiaceae bacterium]